MPRSWKPTDIAVAQNRLKDIHWQYGMKRLGTLGARGGAGYTPGPEFASASQMYQRLGALGMPSDISGVGGLNAAEQAALAEQQENIGTQLSQQQQTLRDTIARLGGGGSEAQEAMENLSTGAMSARVQALRGALQAGQQRVERRRGEALTGWQAGAGGLSGLAGQRQAGEQFNQQMMLKRLQMLTEAGMSPFVGGQTVATGGGQTMYPQGYSPGGLFDPARYDGGKFTRDLTATELRNQYLWPTQYGRQQSYRWY